MRCLVLLASIQLSAEQQNVRSAMTATTAKVEQLQEQTTSATTAATNAAASAADAAAAANSSRSSACQGGVIISGDMEGKLELLRRDLEVVKLKVDALAVDEVRAPL